MLLPALLMILFCVRLLRTEPLRNAAAHPDRAGRILLTAMETALSLKGLPRGSDETLDEYATRLETRVRNIPLRGAFSAYAAATYGRHPLDAEPLRDAWRKLRAALAPIDRIRVRLRLLTKKI